MIRVAWQKLEIHDQRRHMIRELRCITIFCRMPYLYRDKASYFPPKSAIISGSFPHKRPATQGKEFYALPPPCKMSCIQTCCEIHDSGTKKKMGDARNVNSKKLGAIYQRIRQVLYASLDIENCFDWIEAASNYGVATISRLLKMIGLFCRISSLL